MAAPRLPEVGDRDVAERARVRQDVRDIFIEDEAEDYLTDLDLDMEVPSPYEQH